MIKNKRETKNFGKYLKNCEGAQNNTVFYIYGSGMEMTRDHNLELVSASIEVAARTLQIFYSCIKRSLHCEKLLAYVA